MPVWRDTRNGRWRYRFKHKGQRYQGTAPRHCNTKTAALQAERDRLFALERPEALPPPPERKEIPSFAAFAREFMQTYAKTNNKPSEQKAKSLALKRHLLPMFGSLPVDRIRVREVEQLKACLLDGKRSRKTVNNLLAVLSKILRYAEEIEVIEKAPRVRLLKVERQSFDFLDFEEYEALLKTAEQEPQWYAAILLAGDAGLRLGEIRALRLDDWERRTNRIVVQRALWQGVEGSTKGWNRRTIPLTSRLDRALRAVRHLRGPFVLCDADGKPLTMETMRWHLPKLCRRAGLRPIGWHALRHTFCSHLSIHGAPVRTIQELAGHASLSTTLKYMHLVPGVTDAAIALLEGGYRMPTNPPHKKLPPNS